MQKESALNTCEDKTPLTGLITLPLSTQFEQAFRLTLLSMSLYAKCAPRSPSQTFFQTIIVFFPPPRSLLNLHGFYPSIPYVVVIRAQVSQGFTQLTGYYARDPRV